jgi:PAS domain S-box-containing protein
MLNLAEELRARVGELDRVRRHHVREHPEAAADPKQMMADMVVSDFVGLPQVMLVIADLVEGRFLRFNQAVCDVLGYSERELLEVSFIDRVHPDDRTKTLLEMGRLAEGERTSGFRNRHLDADGTYRIFEWTAIADESRELCYAMAVEISD